MLINYFVRFLFPLKHLRQYNSIFLHSKSRTKIGFVQIDTDTEEKIKQVITTNIIKFEKDQTV